MTPPCYTALTEHQPDDVDDDVTTTTSGSYSVDMTDNGADWRRQIADIYQGVLV